MVFNTTFNNISAISRQSVLLVEETGVPREKHQPAASHWQTFITYCCTEYTLTWAGFELTALVVIHRMHRYKCSCKSNYYTITATTTQAWISQHSNHQSKFSKQYHVYEWTIILLVMSKKIIYLKFHCNMFVIWTNFRLPCQNC